MTTARRVRRPAPDPWPAQSAGARAADPVGELSAHSATAVAGLSSAPCGQPPQAPVARRSPVAAMKKLARPRPTGAGSSAPTKATTAPGWQTATPSPTAKKDGPSLGATRRPAWKSAGPDRSALRGGPQLAGTRGGVGGDSEQSETETSDTDSDGYTIVSNTKPDTKTDDEGYLLHNDAESEQSETDSSDTDSDGYAVVKDTKPHTKTVDHDHETTESESSDTDSNGYALVKDLTPEAKPPGATKRAPRAAEPAGPGSSRPHRAFQVSGLIPVYADEPKSDNTTAGTIIARHLKMIEFTWQIMQNPAAYKDPASPQSEAVVAALKKMGAPVEQPVTTDKIIAAARGKHAFELERLRRQDFDVTDTGVVMETIDGKRNPAELDRDGDPVLKGRRVNWDDTDESQEKTRVEFRGGKLFRCDASEQPGPADTSDSVTHFSGAGYEIFVVDERNEIHMQSHKVGKYHHSSLLAGNDVAMAGEMKVVQGTVEYMSNKSGHYKPTMEGFIQFLHFLEKDGVSLDFPVGDFTGKPAGTAKELLHGKRGSAEPNPQLAFEAIKTNVVWQSILEEFGPGPLDEVIREQGWTGHGSQLLDADGKPVTDLRAVRKLLKQKLNGQKPMVKVETRKDFSANADTTWKR